MGCGNGKMVKVSPAEVATVKTNTTKLVKVKEVVSDHGSQTSLKSGERPFGSATSKVSKRSDDSGYNGHDSVEDENHDDYAHIITENSDAMLVQEIENSFKEHELGKLKETSIIIIN